MEFVIFMENDHIYDPETGEDLGVLETVKGRVKVYYVMPKLSRAKTFSYQVRIPGVRESIAAFAALDYERYETRTHKLQVLEEDISPVNDDLTVKVGDKVKSV